MKKENSFVTHALELMDGLDALRARAMFGGWGLYCDDLFFALVSDDELFFKVDARNRAQFEEAGSSPFVYASPADGKTTTLNYFRAPDAVWDESGAMQRWAKLGFEAAERAASKKKAK